MDYVLLEWEMDYKARKLRKQAHREMAKRVGKIALAILILVIFFVMAWFWGEGNDIAHAEGANKNPVVNVHGGDKITYPEYVYTFTDEEETALLNIMMSEARGEGTEGMALIANVVLNRVSDGRFPSNIVCVIEQPCQFAGGRCFTPSDECLEALEMIRQGWDESQGALFFRTTSGTFTWATYLFTHGNHAFYIA